MADERELSAKIDFDTSGAEKGVDDLSEKQKKLREDIKETGQELDKIGVNMAGIGTSARSAFTGASQNAKDFGTTVRSAVLESIKRGDSLAKTIKTGIGTGFQWAGGQVKGFGAATVSVAKNVGSAFAHPIQTIKSTLGHALNDARKGVKDVGDEADKSGDKLKKMNEDGSRSGEGLIGTLKRIAVAALAIAALTAAANAVKDFTMAAVDAAAAAEETQSKFETVFKETAGVSDEWITNFSAAAKRSKVEIRGFMADAQSVFTGVGMGVEPASKMSAAMTSLSYDLASFHNLSDADAFDKLRSGMLGQTQGLRTMGIVLNDASLKQEMLNMGLRGNFADLDEATKMQVRFNAILAQTTDAQSDVTRTSDSYTNGLKGIQGMWSDFMADAGAKFLPTLVSLFNAILDAWPQIQPALMGLVDILAEGLQTVMPMLIELGKTLLPVITQAMQQVLRAIMPILPVIMDLIGTLLPPLAELFGTLASTILPPLTQIFTVLINDVLQPILPIFMDLISALLPPFVELLSMIAPILQMLSPFLTMLAQLLVPIAQVIGSFVSSLLPPLMQILDVIFNSILKPLMPVIQMLVEALLPPIAQLLGVIAPILQMIAPILEALSPIISFIGEVLGFIVGIIAKIIEFVANGIGKVVSFFSSIFGGAKEAKEETAGLADNMAEIGAASDQSPAAEAAAATPAYTPPPIPVPDTSAYTSTVTSAMDTMPTANAAAMTQMRTDTGTQMATMGTTANNTYTAMTDDSTRAWDTMADAAERGVSAIIQQFDRLRRAALDMGSLSITVAGATLEQLPHYARGTNDHPGGPAIINDDRGQGEMVVLPDGSEVIPADKTDRLISRTSSRTVVSQPVYRITITGNPTEEQKAETEAWIREVARREREDAERQATTEERIQEAYV